MTDKNRFCRTPLLLVGVLALIVALPAVGENPPTDDERSNAELTREAIKAKRAQEDPRQREDYLRHVPIQGLLEEGESDIIKMHTAREWSLLTYPTGTLPSAPWERARRWVKANVVDAPPLPGPSVDIGRKFDWQKLTLNPDVNSWIAAGPHSIESVGTTNNAYTYGTVAGRVGAGALAVDPNNTDVAYAGFVAGGLWKTTNLSAATPSWAPLWDDLDYVTQGVSSIEIDPNNSQVLYVGTGDFAALDQFSAGIMKSTDGGATWTQLAADVFAPYSQTLPAGGNRWSNQNSKTIQVDPYNSNTVLVGTRYDLYVSNDAGSTWQICAFGNGYTDPDPASGATQSINRITNIYVDDRSNPAEVYLSVGYLVNDANGNNGVYRFTMPASGCPSWPADFTTYFSGLPAGTGNGVVGASGGGNTGRIEMTGTVASDGDLTLYLQVATGDNLDAEGTYVLRPDTGSTWTKIFGSSYTDCGGGASSTGQDWYDLFIAVDPTDDKTVYIGHIDAFKGTVNSSYSSMSVTNLTNVYTSGCPEYGVIHPDQHAFTFVGNTSAFLLGNDGGVYYNDQGGALAGWKQLNDDFNALQFYAGQIGADFAGNGMNGVQWLMGGLQDNGNASWDSSLSDTQWTGRSVGGDGFYTTFDPLNATETSGIWMTEYVYGSLYSSTSGANGPFEGKNFFTGCEPNYAGSPDWSTPFLLDTLHCSSGSCDNYVLGEDYVWAANSFRQGCPAWTRVSGSLVKTSSGSILTVGLAPSEPKAAAVGTSDGKVWWSGSVFSGTSCTQADANTSAFACSENGSATWVDADAANAILPNRAVNQVAFDPTDHNTFYAAVGGFNTNTPTTPGHFFAFTQSSGSITVTDKTGNLPDVPASSVAVNPHNRKQVFVGTYFGFYLTDDIDANPVVWTRYQTGLPNTVIKYLTIDRGPASDPIKGTTLAAFTYGRGVYLLRLPTGGGGNQAPVADFSYSCTDLDCTFTDLSTDADGTVVAWSWDFGDTSSSTAQNPSHSFAAAGTYTVTLTVTDDASDTGMTSQQVTVTAPGGNNPPVADFSYSCTDLDCTFTDLSTDSDGTVVAWSWDFGDTSSSTSQNPSHSFAAAGTYTVTLTVTDDASDTGMTSQQVTVTAPSGGITLSANGYKVKGVHTIDLTWSGATSTNVDVYRDGGLIVTTANDGAYTDSTGNKGGGSYVYEVCEEGTTTCSNPVTVVF